MRTDRLFILILLLSLLICSCDKSTLRPVSLHEPSEWITAKVVVVLPLSDDDRHRYERISRMFMENTVKAQYDLSEGVRLELEWIDENSLDVNKFANDLYYRDDVDALIGPLKDENVDIVAKTIYKKGIPMFVMTSSEGILRRYSSGTAGVLVKEPFMWSLSDTDIVQAQIILAKAGSMGVEKLSLICADNDYGDTFNKWVPHYARENKLNILDKVQYSDTEELADGFGRIATSDAEVVICALNDADDAKTVLELAKSNPHAPKIYFTGSLLNTSLLELGPLAEGAEGFSMYPSPYTGFHQAYKARFGELPMQIEAQLYDSFLLSLISFAHCHYSGRNISMNRALAQFSDLPLSKNEEIHESVFWETTNPIWDYAALGESVLKLIREGRIPELNLVGALGNLKFTSESYTNLAKTSYINWQISKGRPVALDFIDEQGTRYFSYVTAWDWMTTMDKIENGSNSKYEVSLREGNKAVLICGSEGWYNYRHQADLLYVYNILKENHFTDDDIILIMRDDLAFHPKNPHQGVIRISPGGENLYHDVVIDYRADTLSTRDIEDILLGNETERLSTVLESTEVDNVLLYWTGHGTDKSFTWLETGEKFTDVQFGETVRKMYENKKYQSMLVCAEPCYSGSVVKAIEGTPLVLGFSAASEDESSYADNYSSELGVWMCDRFTYNLIRLYKGQNYINLLDVYKMLNASTIGSNVKVYNYDYYYDLADVMLWDYFYDFNY